ncbi:calponin homology domain-containing protein DDB_G0272472-like [Macrobrachium rosenbergii]|uniref:calponin homology domain-containing protein DDB_G0272472-like n=1 Tax=Macrobrachium rosenbergii TaxID=79674 RepID=UPI0034D3A963
MARNLESRLEDIESEENLNSPEMTTNSEAQNKSQDMEKPFKEDKIRFQKSKEQIRVQIGRLSHKIDFIRKHREVEMENAAKTINGLKEENHQNRSEIVRLSKMAQEVQKEQKAVTERYGKTVNNLRQMNKELEAEADLVYSDYQALQEQRQQEKETANETINDLQIMNDQLQKEIADKESSAKRHRHKTDEMEQVIRQLKGDLERAEEQNRVHIESQSQLLKEKRELQKTIKQQGQVIKDLNEEKQRLETELMEKEANKDDHGCQNSQKESPPKEGKSQRKLIIFDLEPELPQIETSVSSSHGHSKVSPESQQANNGPKEDEKMIVTVKERRKATKIEEDEAVDKKETQKPQKAQKPERKLITFDLEPDQPEMDRCSSSHLPTLPPRHGCPRRDQQEDCIIFRGEMVQVKRLQEMEGEWTVELDIPRNFHRAINGIQGRTLEEITLRSGVALIKMPGKFEASDLITIFGTIHQIRLAAGHIERIISKLY